MVSMIPFKRKTFPLLGLEEQVEMDNTSASAKKKPKRKTSSTTTNTKKETD